MATGRPGLYLRLPRALRAVAIAISVAGSTLLTGSGLANVHFDAYFPPGESGNWETEPQIQLAILLRQPAVGEATVGYWTEDETAVAGSDYTAVSGIATFPHGQSQALITISLLNDSLPEHLEKLRVHLRPGKGTPSVGPAATAFISSDEGPEPDGHDATASHSSSSGNYSPPDSPSSSAFGQAPPPPPGRGPEASLGAAQPVPLPPPPLEPATPSNSAMGAPAPLQPAPGSPPPSSMAPPPPSSPPVLTVGPGSGENADGDETSARGSGPLAPLLLAGLLFTSWLAPTLLGWYRRRSAKT